MSEPPPRREPSSPSELRFVREPQRTSALLQENQPMLTPTERLNRDIRNAATRLSDNEVRHLVDGYYIMQKNRMRADAQVRSMGGEPHEILDWLSHQSFLLEEQVKEALNIYTMSHPIGEWMRSINGIGPITAAGLLAHIDITKCTSVGDIWRFAGLDPTNKWERGKKRPWNATLKTVCFHIGISFIRYHGKKSSYYQKVYQDRRKLETERNEAGLFAKQAADILERFKYSKSTVAYKCYSKGQLPPAHIVARARRYAVKLFLSHLFEVWYEHHHRCKPPLPYPIAFLEGHDDYLKPLMNGEER